MFPALPRRYQGISPLRASQCLCVGVKEGETLHYRCYGLILSRTERQERDGSSRFRLSSFRPKLVTQCEFKGGLSWSVLGLLQAHFLPLQLVAM